MTHFEQCDLTKVEEERKVRACKRKWYHYQHKILLAIINRNWTQIGIEEIVRRALKRQWKEERLIQDLKDLRELEDACSDLLCVRHGAANRDLKPGINISPGA